MELALWCDLRVMEEDATFGVFCRRFGVPLIDGGSVRLPRLIGLSRAMDLILTGASNTVVSGKYCCDLGHIDCVWRNLFHSTKCAILMIRYHV